MKEKEEGTAEHIELQHLQNQFCQVSNVCICCLDKNFQLITEPSGEQKQLPKLKAFMDSSTGKEILLRVREGSLEEQAVEKLGEDLAAAIAVEMDEDNVIYWLLYATGVSEEKFQKVLDFVRNTSRLMFAYRMDAMCFGEGADSKSKHFAEQEMNGILKGVEVTAELIQLLDREEIPIEAVMEEWLKVLAGYIQADTAQLYQLNPSAGLMNILAEWYAPGQVSMYEKTSNLEILDILRLDKPLIISSDDFAHKQRQAMEELGLNALLVFPVLCRENGANIVFTLNFRKRKHNWRMLEIRFISDAVKILLSILTKRIQKNSLASSYEVLEAVLDNVGCAIYVTDMETGEKLFANRKLQNTFFLELKNGSFMELLERGVVHGQSKGSFEIHHYEREHWYDLIYKEIAWVDGRKAMLYSLYDITDKKLYQRKIEQQAYTDFLTGLYNRMCCERDLARQIDEARMNRGKGALLYLDLDDFKHINDGLGHQYGDVLLKAISHSLQRINGIESSCYRMGGDEFVIIISPANYSRYDDILKDIQKIFVKPWFLKDTDYYCTMSMGVVTYPDKGDSVTDLIKKADIAMYEAKKSGKNRIAYYSEGTDSTSGRRLDMEKNMRDAAGEGCEEFEVYYQPIIDVEDGKAECAGAEALIRWNSSKFGFIPPAEFIPLAEYLGLINPIGNYVLREACIRCKYWNDNGHPDYKVNVNLSVVQLLQVDIVDIVKNTLEETGIKPKNLTLEVTESLAINDMERMKQILGKIKELGVKIALDDFGTGYSSLNHIREIPFDVIKVDQSFVRDLAEDAYSQSFIKMVSELARTIGVKICVEGIETQAQYDVLKNMQVKYIQGFYFDRPMRSHDFEMKYCINE